MRSCPRGAGSSAAQTAGSADLRDGPVPRQAIEAVASSVEVLAHHCPVAARHAGFSRRPDPLGRAADIAEPGSLRCVKWPYRRLIDPAHAWGVIAVGTAGLAAIPAILATLHATDAHFRWWWPTNWMAVPAAIFLIGVGLIALTVGRSEQDARVAAVAGAGETTVAGISRMDGDDEPRMLPQPRTPGPALKPARVAGERLHVVPEPMGHAFISYVQEDAGHVDQLQQNLQDAGIPVWRDTADLWPGQDWRAQIRDAITGNALVFLACFSQASLARARSHQNDEILLAIEQLRLRRPYHPWLIPVRFSDCQIPDQDIGGGRTLTSLQPADLFGDRCHQNTQRLSQAIQRILTVNRI